MWDSLVSWSVKLGVSVGAIYAVGLGLMYVFQDKMVYVPRIPGIPAWSTYLPDRFNLEYEDVWLTTEDGENAGDLQQRLYFLRLMAQYLHVSILGLSYRGYGPSQGQPSERGLQLDAKAALRHLRTERQDVDPSKVLLFGRSIGGAVALHLAAAHPGQVRAAIVENTFTSIVDLAPSVAPVLRPVIGPGRPFNWLVTQRWDNRGAAAALRALPILWVSAGRDEMIPQGQMRELFRLHGGDMSLPSSAAAGTAGSSCCWEWDEYANGHHMDIYEMYQVQYWHSLQRFTAKHAGGPPAKAAALQAQRNGGQEEGPTAPSVGSTRNGGVAITD